MNALLQNDSQNNRNDIGALRATAAEKVAEHNVYQRRFAEQTQMREKAIDGRKVVEEVTAISQACARKVQDRLGLTVGGLVTECLKSILPEEDVSFIPIFETKRNQTECDFVLVDKHANRYDPMKCNGGGIWDIIAFALRVCVLLLESDPHRNVLILDEPFKFLHGKEQQERAFEVLMKIASKVKTQIIVITQDGLTDERAVSYSVTKGTDKKSIVKETE